MLKGLAKTRGKTKGKGYKDWKEVLFQVTKDTKNQDNSLFWGDIFPPPVNFSGLDGE